MSAPSTSTYLLQSPDSGLPNAQALSSLGTGIIKNTGSAMAIASPTADYLPYHANLASIGAITVNVGDMLVGTDGNVWTTVPAPEELKTWICDGINPPRWGDSGAVNAAYLLTAPGGGEENMPNRRFLQVGSGLQVIDNGPAGFLDINTTGLLNSLSTLSGHGILVRLSGGTAVTRSITSSSSISVTNGDGEAGNISMSLIPSSVVQNTNYALNGVIQNSSSTLNFVSSPGVEVEIANGGSNITNLYLSSASAGTDINYVTLTDNTAVLPDSFPLSSMSTGIVKVTHTTGALTTAVAGTDYLAPSANLTSISSAGHVLGELLVANGSGYGTLGIGSTGQVLTVASGTASWATPATPAPTTATYILNTADAGLPDAFDLSTLPTGSLQVTTTTGALTSISPQIFVKAVADGTLPSYTYASGVITFTANGAIGSEFTDNVVTSTSDIVFNNDFTGGNEPYLGAYVITAKGTGGTQEVWTRVNNFNSSANMVAGIEFIPTNGLVYANSSLIFTTQGAITVGTTPLKFRTDAFTRSWSFQTSLINSGSVAQTIAFNIPAGRIFYPTAIFSSSAAESYTSIPYYFDGTTATDLGTAFGIPGGVVDTTWQYTLNDLVGSSGSPTMKSSSGATQAGIGIDVSIASTTPDNPTYTFVGNWIRTA